MRDADDCEGAGIAIIAVFLILFWVLRALFQAADQSK